MAFGLVSLTATAIGKRLDNIHITDVPGSDAVAGRTNRADQTCQDRRATAVRHQVQHQWHGLRRLTAAIILISSRMEKPPVKSLADIRGQFDVVTIYREGILALARTPRGGISTEALREQIRVTVLHELGHHHGLTETDLEQLGYG